MKNFGFGLFITLFSYLFLTLVLMMILFFCNLGLPGEKNGISEFTFDLCIVGISFTSVGIALFATNKH
jgi:hypothetical protein